MSYERLIYLADTDAAGVVYFAHLLSICHEAYEFSLAQFGINVKDFLKNSPVTLPITQAEIQFFRPLVCGDRIQIDFTARSLSENEFELQYKIYLAEIMVGKARTRHVCIAPTNRQRIPFPESFKNWLRYLSTLEETGI
ncbi:MAG: acyl-CoA thioesterase [Microcystis novacekii Mn_MB_F_20050700_S1]|uniref:1,4-dihydroxy-2-naphthoyl-CoA hydrolase n=1 Tax=Microcystis novacekii Mn_MB_F_20050700_S1D TaxID=2486266 RepID=A0A552JBA3_9CHRO|nr:MAG: acyl-CoA thioesterase [Microcystis novacekii Mn_MB_F_20050700_S1]TRU93050.1 MAG: acyl-CoA thioesterase [Microcystis novacekii Mn_MB_F_20050700_S1D]